MMIAVMTNKANIKTITNASTNSEASKNAMTRICDSHVRGQINALFFALNHLLLIVGHAVDAISETAGTVWERASGRGS